MKEIKVYIDRLFRDVPESQRKEEIKKEILLNLEEKINDLVEKGEEKEYAINKAIDEFGDAEEIKRELFDRPYNQKNNAGVNLIYSLFGSLLIAGVVIFTNLYYTPDIIWFVYPVFIVLWWPLTMFYVWIRKRRQVK